MLGMCMCWMLNVYGDNTKGSPCHGNCSIDSTVLSTVSYHLRIMVPDIYYGDTVNMKKCLQTGQKMHVKIRCNRLQCCIVTVHML